MWATLALRQHLWCRRDRMSLSSKLPECIVAKPSQYRSLHMGIKCHWFTVPLYSKIKHKSHWPSEVYIHIIRTIAVRKKEITIIAFNPNCLNQEHSLDVCCGVKKHARSVTTAPQRKMKGKAYENRNIKHKRYTWKPIKSSPIPRTSLPRGFHQNKVLPRSHDFAGGLLMFVSIP